MSLGSENWVVKAEGIPGNPCRQRRGSGGGDQRKMSIDPLHFEVRSAFLIAPGEVEMDFAHANIVRLSSSPRLLGRSPSIINQVCFHSGYPPVTRKHAIATRSIELST